MVSFASILPTIQANSDLQDKIINTYKEWMDERCKTVFGAMVGMSSNQAKNFDEWIKWLNLNTTTSRIMSCQIAVGRADQKIYLKFKFEDGADSGVVSFNDFIRTGNIKSSAVPGPIDVYLYYTRGWE